MHHALRASGREREGAPKLVQTGRFLHGPTPVVEGVGNVSLTFLHCRPGMRALPMRPGSDVRGFV
jgi:hypothetical protein